MDNHFNFNSQDPCLRFIREDSSQNASDLFKIQNSDSNIKIQEENFPEELGKQFNSPHSRQKSKKKSQSKKKTFYRDKMAILISQQNFVRPEYNYGDNNQSGRGKAPISREQQLRRNRQSAKNSRQRRKQYIQTLEEKNAQSQKLIEDLKLKLHQAELERDRLRQDNGSYIKTFITSKNEAFDTLNQSLKFSGKKHTQQISEALKVMKAKYGAAGSERICTTDYYMKEIIEILVGDIHKYLMECVRKDCGLFGLGDWNKIDSQVSNVLGVKKQMRIHLSHSYSEQMNRQFDRFKEVTHRFYEAYQSVQIQAKVIQRIFDQISLQFQDESIVRLLLWFEQNKFLKEIKKMRSQWAQSIESPQQYADKVRKMSKNI